MPRPLDHPVIPDQPRASRYDWDEILSGSPQLWVKGEDYFCKHANFASQCRQQSAARGIGVKLKSVKTEDNKLGWEVQAVGDTSHHTRRRKRMRVA